MSDDKVYKPNDKELKLFEQEKMDLYKGTFVVCIVYGLSAVILLVLILFTDGGKEFIYDKFAPAVVTYIIGSLIIILYLLNSIYTIRPRRIGNDMDTENNIMCPDFWKLEKVKAADKTILIDNNTRYDSNNIIPEITRDTDKNIQYKCVYDENVYGDTRNLLSKKKGILGDNTDTKFLAGFANTSNALAYATNPSTSVLSPNYIVGLPTNIEPTNVKGLKSYAKFSGGYTQNNTTIFKTDNDVGLRPAKTEYVPGGAIATILGSYETNTPLICNQVYPQVLGILDSKTKDENEISCEYAKQCGISWSSLNCKNN